MSAIRSLVLVLALSACASETPTSLLATGSTASARGSSDAAEPRFITAAPGAPAIANPVIHFWARKGIDQTVRMYYASRPGQHDSVAFFSIRIRPKSLFRRPDGGAIAMGDSILITLTLADAQHLVVDCQPSGLQFDPKAPARITMSYGNADVDGDGVATPLDLVLTHALLVWRHESATSPWLAVPSSALPEANEVEADIRGFTGYALAW